MDKKAIEEIIEKEINPFLKEDGGKMELVKVQKNKIFVKFEGKCLHCPYLYFTLKNFVEKKLKEHFKNIEIEIIQ